MTAYVTPPPGLSRAMTRVATALAAHAPPWIRIVPQEAAAQLVVLHVIGADAVDETIATITGRGQRVAIVQYCVKTTARAIAAWVPTWQQAQVVWSYYSLPHLLTEAGAYQAAASFANFYHAPLGVDEAFRAEPAAGRRPIGVVTSGYVSAGQEAIWEVALAAERLGLLVHHIGPPTIQGMPRRPAGWASRLGDTDRGLAATYAAARWVSGLRFTEGFELPALEGLVQGARPICFDRAEMRHWYADHAVFVPEVADDALVEQLVAVLQAGPAPVTAEERAAVRARFDWAPICRGFWERVG